MDVPFGVLHPYLATIMMVTAIIVYGFIIYQVLKFLKFVFVKLFLD